ncbi:Uncharacterized membrane protein, DUF441 family [Paenibacillus sp. UNCCL117]|nr:Uncharacterized membrane protein, DUF441 family [Paenibacillus sp. cl123]SFW47309.1 Uncharacterized membrane protein, DUF441 family [Paenibacillus sp. UNCCL117]
MDKGPCTMNGDILLVALIIIGLIGRSHIITTAACVLLVIKLISLERYLPTIERRGLELGLLFLTMGVLVPFASEKISIKDVTSMFTTWPGVLALLGGAIATYMNGKGLELLKIDPQMIVGLVIGSIIGIIFLKGIPVGPLMAAGITAFLLKVFTLLFDKLR